MNDLLGDAGGGYPPQNQRSFNNDVEDPEQEPSGNDSMAGFFQEVDETKKSMTVIKRNLAKLKETNERTKNETRAPKLKVLKESMEADINEVTKIARGIKNKVESLDRSNAENRKVVNCGEGTPTDRTRMSITNTLKKNLKELMEEFQELRNKFNAEYREVVERRYFTVTGVQPNEEVVDQMVDSGDAEAIFRKAIQEQGRGQVIDTLNEIQERADAVKDIEKQLLELHQIFMDMATLVESQGELLNDIESNVGKATEHVQGGVKMLVKARELQKNTRKWICCGISVVIIVVVVVVLFVVKPWQIKTK